MFISWSLTCSGSAGQSKEVATKLYQFIVPNEWIIVDTDSNSYSSVMVPRERLTDSSRTFLTVTMNRNDCKSIDQCFETYLGEGYKKEYDSFSLAAEGTSSISNREARWMEYTCLKWGSQQRFLVYLVYDEKRLFLVKAVARNKDFEKYREDFMKISNSFRIK